MAKKEELNNGEIMLFGVRVVVDSMRKSVSLNNLSQYEHRLDSSSSSNDAVIPPPSGGVNGGGVSGGYASADDAVVHRSSAPSRERKRGVPWTEEEHKLFLLGLQKVGKGDWRGISRNFVKTRTPTQVASHAQKYFLRRTNLKSKGRRRSSLFDITTTDTVNVNQTNDHQINKNSGSHSPPPPQQQPQEVFDSSVRFSVTQPETSGFFSYPTTTSFNNQGSDVYDHEMKIMSPGTTSNSNNKSVFDLNNNKDESISLSLNLSLSLGSSPSDLMNCRFQVVQGDCRISVA